MTGIATVLGVLLAVVAVMVLLRRRPSPAIAEQGRQLVADVPATPATVALLERWRDRAHRWRQVVAVPAVVGSIVGNLVLRQSVDVGVGAHPAWADPLLTGLVGAFLGAIAAEAHHLRTRSSGPRTVDLTPRDVRAYLPHPDRRRLVALGIAAAVATLGALVLVDGHVPTLGLLALALAVVVPVTQHGIVTRARPALAPDLRRADDAVRRLAVRSVDEAGAGAMILLVAWQLAPVYTAVDAPTGVETAMGVAQLASLVLAVVWWRRSHPRRLLPDVAAALGPPAHHETPA